jgi:thiamine-phosphate pyrophosphorylase
MPDFPGGVYALTPETADTPRLLAQVEAALAGGVAVVQYRDKSGDVARRHEEASELAALCRRFGVPLIVNDDLRLANLAGADGVHLGRDDGSIREARIILGPKKFIGASCYQSLDRARAAQADGADYVAFGSFFPSPTKPDAAPAGLELLREARPVIHVPIVAIGGITAANAPQLIDAGADALAVLSALFDAPDVRARAQTLSRLFIERASPAPTLPRTRGQA